MSSCPKGCVRVQGLGFTIVMLIVSIFTIFMAVSNCIAYGNIISKDDPVIAKNWAIFLLVLNIILSIIGFVVFFVIIYKFFNSRAVKNFKKDPSQVFLNASNKFANIVMGDGSSSSQQDMNASSFIPHTGQGFQEFFDANKSKPEFRIAVAQAGLNPNAFPSSCSDGISQFKCAEFQPVDKALNMLYENFA